MTQESDHPATVLSYARPKRRLRNPPPFSWVDFRESWRRFLANRQRQQIVVWMIIACCPLGRILDDGRGGPAVLALLGIFIGAAIYILMRVGGNIGPSLLVKSQLV